MRIFIGGVSNRGYELLRKAVPKYDLVFGDNSKEPQRWRKASRHCDIAVLMTKFISHKHVEAIRREGLTIIYTNGGVNGLIAEVKRLGA